jgi:ATP-dependent Clp protease adaptor protein ClpS
MRVPGSYTQNLQDSLRRTVVLAEAQNRKRATPEDLLLALIDDPDAGGVMRGLSVDFERLCGDLARYMESAVDETDGIIDGLPEPSRLSADLRRVLGYAVTEAGKFGRQLAAGSDVLIELFSEPAGHFLQQQGLTLRGARDRAAESYRKPDRVSAARAGAAATDPAACGPLANVRLLNDDHTPMEFVVHVLEQIFEMDCEPAVQLMLEVHNAGAGVCGVYPLAVAQAKVTEALDLARKHQHPLQCVLQQIPSA